MQMLDQICLITFCLQRGQKGMLIIDGFSGNRNNASFNM